MKIRPLDINLFSLWFNDSEEFGFRLLGINLYSLLGLSIDEDGCYLSIFFKEFKIKEWKTEFKEKT